MTAEETMAKNSAPALSLSDLGKMAPVDFRGREIKSKPAPQPRARQEEVVQDLNHNLNQTLNQEPKQPPVTKSTTAQEQSLDENEDIFL